MKTADVIIVGSGASGLFNALFLPQDYKVIVITKKEVEESDSFLAMENHPYLPRSQVFLQNQEFPQVICF